MQLVLIKLLIKTAVQWYVKRTDNEWDDKLYLLANSFLSGKPNEQTQKLIGQLIEELMRSK